MSKQPFHPLVFFGVLLGALVGTFVVPGLGTVVGILVGGAVGFIAHHRRLGRHEEPKESILPPRM